MKKLEVRSIICLTMAAILLLGTGIFVFRFVKYGSKWATFYGNRSIYENGVLRSGAIYDRNDNLLAKSGGGEIKYSDDEYVRAATVHTVGDVNGKIATSALRVYKDKLIGYKLLTGTYKLKGRNDDVKLTLDSDVCKAAYKELLNYDAGCIGVYNYKTGEIICMVSTPSFDPENEPKLEADDRSGIYINRFLSSTLPPGSIFKTVTSAAIIENVPDYDSFSYDCTGVRMVHGEPLKCAYPHGHVDFTGALASSCNGSFSILTEKVGAETMSRYVDKLGLTKSYDIDGISNAKGSFEFPENADLNLGWAGIGQYHDRLNPCSMMVYMGAIANGGKAAVPKILMPGLGFTDMTEQMIDEKTSEKLTEMMKATVERSYGSHNYPNLDIYAKTGTAEVEGKNPNGWFAGFIKNEDHPYAFVICLENSGEALYTAAPVANAVLQVAISK